MRALALLALPGRRWGLGVQRKADALAETAVAALLVASSSRSGSWASFLGPYLNVMGDVLALQWGRPFA